MPEKSISTGGTVTLATEIGLGAAQARFKVYVAKRPPMQEYVYLPAVQPLLQGEIAFINQACGNGWRKLFNVYAKLLFALPASFGFLELASSWQDYRDSVLLQAGSDTALLFSSPQLTSANNILHIIAGRTHAKDLIAAGLPLQLNWLNAEFAVDPHNRVLVCPYFDYRQLNNEKIGYLVQLMTQL